MYQLINNNWQNAGFDSEILFLELIQNNSFLTPEKTLLAFLNDGVYWLDPVSANWQKLNSTVGNIRALKVDEDSNLWVGIEEKGIAKYNYQTNGWDVTEINSPARNSFVGLALDLKGRLWTASISGGIQMLDGDTWTNYSTANGLPSNDYRTILVDSQDRVWAGSWGGGLVVLEENQGEIAVTKFDTTNNILAGYEAAHPGFVLVPAIALDKFDNLWIANRQAVNNRVLVTHTPNDQFVHFSTTQGIISNILFALMVDQFGRVWIGTDRGVNVMEYEEGFTNVDFSQGLNSSEGLFSNTITALAEDDDGTVWVGTDAGLNIWFDGIVDEEFDTPVNAIGIDGINNKWIGTNNGITILKGHFDKVADFTPGNSQLVQGKITSFAFNFTTGEVWIGTDRGLSKATTLFTAPKDDLSQLTGFPNPFIINGSDKIFTITNLANNTNVSIFTSTGKLVKSFKASQDILGAQAFWNGTDEDGKLVASGVYIYLAYTEDNVSATGKVAVVRR